MDDLISRQAALDALGKRPTVWTDDNDYAHGMRNQYDMDRLAIETVPSAQPTDEDIQRMQDIEQAMLEKAYECGKQDAMQWIPCSECDRMVEVYDNLDRDTMERVRKEYEKEGDTIGRSKLPPADTSP